jgi:hypothetical protein
MMPGGRQAHPGHARLRGSVFPIREGGLHVFVSVFARLDVRSAVSDVQLQHYAVDAWVYLCLRSLNALAGAAAGLVPGRWTASELAAQRSVRAAVTRKLATDSIRAPLTLEGWQKELHGRQVGYTGEELSTCHKLTWDQVIPALPPEGHGGSIKAIDWVGPQTLRFLLNPTLLLKEPELVELPKMPGKVHIDEGDKLKIALELVRRGVCEWIPFDDVYSVGGIKVLNGLFGVEKPALLEDGRCVLRCIMNLTGSNATQWQLEGGTTSLPTITAWQGIVLDEGESIQLFQSDMCSAFYLFELPAIWRKFLSFNIVVSCSELGLPGNNKMALACKVIPMGWLSSVSLMQEISENLLKVSGLNPRNQVARGVSLPHWFSDILTEAKDTQAFWWHIYLDNFCAGERLAPWSATDRGRMAHEAAEAAWSEAGVLSSSKKRVTAAARALELGAEIDGEQAMLGVSSQKLLHVILSTLWLVTRPLMNRKHVQIIAGRWMFILQFRRPAMSFLQKLWHFTGGHKRITKTLRDEVRKELLNLVGASLLFHCNLGAKIMNYVVASDASTTGGAIGWAEELTETGHDFIQACQKLERAPTSQTIPVLVISLFNGVGGAFRAYDIIGVVPLARIAVEMDKGANRVTSHRWPGTVIVEDVRLVTSEMIQQWSRLYLGVKEIHLWAGFPCTDLSAVKYNRCNLLGSQSSLFWEVPRISKEVKTHFGPSVAVKEVLENVASMDRSAATEITEEVGQIPYKLDCVQAVPMRRPRFCWTTEKLESLLPDVSVVPGSYFKEVIAEAEYPLTQQWLTPGFTWEGEAQGTVFPTCMKAICRQSPPPRPAGLEKCDSACQARWRDDSYRYPPYQYQDQFLITTDKSWRLLSASEKELLLGYGMNHTEVCWSASKQKQNPVGYSDARHSYLGDSFSIYSFVLLAMACCRDFVPCTPYRFLVQRMGMAPGFVAHIRSTMPLCRGLSYGSMPLQNNLSVLGMQLVNRMLLRRTNHTGSDVRIITGEVLNSKAYPRQSIASAWWKWKEGFSRRWKRKAHINVLELETILWGVKFQIERLKAADARIFQFSDSYVCLSVVGKGRSSSLQIQRVLSKINAHLLAFGLQLIMAHVESTDNPTDKGSRR